MRVWHVLAANVLNIKLIVLNIKDIVLNIKLFVI